MMRSLSVRIALTAFAAVGLVVFCSSCGPKRPRLYPVRGQVFFAGQPAAGALVTFHPVVTDDPSVPLPSGIVQADGSFQLATYSPGDGAPAGQYEVSIVWYGDKEKADESGEMPNKVPARYANAKTSQLKATVEQGATTVPAFQLTK